MKELKGEELILRDKNLSEYQGDDRVISSLELSEELDKIITPSFHTGIHNIDRILNGIEPGELIIVTGPTGEGKTTLLMTITTNLINANVKSAWFSLEVTPKQFISKMMRKTGKLPLFYLPRKNTENTIRWIEERIVEARLKYDTKVIFIDHIHQIFSLERIQGNVSLEIGDMVGKIKEIAIRENIVIFLVAHSKDNPLSMTAEPRKEDIRDSGLISRLADSIIGIWRVPNDYDVKKLHRPKEIGELDNKAKVKIFKNRREGTLGSFLMEHKDHYLQDIEEFYATEDFIG